MTPIATSTQRAAKCPTTCKPDKNAKNADVQDEPYPMKDNGEDESPDIPAGDDTDTT